VGPAITFRISGLRVRAGLATPVAIAVTLLGVASTADRSRSVEVFAAAVAFALVLTALGIHEAVRVAVYRREGVYVRGLDLSLAGGNPALLDRTDSPRREALAAAAGIVVFTALAGAALIAERASASSSLHDLLLPVTVALLAMAILQAMPALPLDGGRLLRGLVWFLTDDPVLGTRAAAIYGHFIAVALMVAGGLMAVGTGALPYWGFGSIVAGLQLMAASYASMRDTLWQQLGGKVTLADADLPMPRRIKSDESIETVVDALISEGNRSALLVIDESGAAVGVIQLADLRRVRRADWANRQAGAVMTPLAVLPLLSQDATPVDAIMELDRRGARLAAVQMDNGRTLLVARESLLDLLVTRTLDTGHDRERGGR
jgi:hypothetical protein